MKIDLISNYLKEIEKFRNIVDKIYFISKDLGEIYPNYKNWFYEKHVVGCYNKTREIIFMKNDKSEVIGFASLKKELAEKKICTIYVKEGYRKKGVSKYLLEKSFEILETNKPLVTFSENNLELYRGIIKKYNWELVEIVFNKYQLGNREYCYNGYLN